MTKRKSWFLTAIFATIILACCVALSACGGSATTYALTWNVAEHATVTVEGYDAVPESVEEDTQIVFSITCDTGYEVDSVKANNTAMTADSSGKYTRTISRDCEFVITVKKTISSVEVTSKPTNLSYYSGESLDTTGMVVTVNYGTGDSETITNYSVSPATFTIGDSSFTVTYKGVTSAAVNLDKTVTALITIDPYSGDIDETWLNALASRSDISNYSVSDDGVISFEHSGLSSAITLPTSDEVYRSGEFSFSGWVYGDSNTAITSIASSSADSYDIMLQWEAVLITANSIRLEYTTYNGVEAPYLIINLTFKEVESAYLYLYEGNDEIALKGTEIEIGDSDTVDLYFNLSELGSYNDGAYAGKWMDLRFNATIDGREYSQSLSLDHDNPIAEVGGSVQDATNSYTILTYRNGDADDIKVAFKPYDTTAAFSVEGTTLTITGNINLNNLSAGADLTGATVSISFADVSFTGTIDSNGAWTISADLTQIATTGVSATNIANFAVYSSTGSTLLSASRLNYTWLTDTFEYTEVFGNPSYYANKYTYGNGMALYIGTMDSSSWTDAFYAVVDEGHLISYNSATLVADSTDGRPLLVISGTYGYSYTAAEAKAVIESEFYLDLQSYSNGWAMRYYSSADTITVVTGDDYSFTVTVDITVIGDTGSEMVIGDVLYGHLGNSSSNMSIAYEGAKVVYNGITYEIGGYDSSKCDSWMNGLAIIYVYDKSVSYSDITITAASDGKPQLVLTGTCDGYSSVTEFAADFYLDLQAYPTWEMRYYSTEDSNISIVLNSDGTFTVTIDLSGTSLAAGDVIYGHLGNNSSNMQVSYTESSVTYGGLTYTIGGYDSEKCDSWMDGLAIIYVTAAA